MGAIDKRGPRGRLVHRFENLKNRKTIHFVTIKSQQKQKKYSLQLVESKFKENIKERVLRTSTGNGVKENQQPEKEELKSIRSVIIQIRKQVRHSNCIKKVSNSK